jgi:hypothetical protein
MAESFSFGASEMRLDCLSQILDLLDLSTVLHLFWTHTRIRASIPCCLRQTYRITYRPHHMPPSLLFLSTRLCVQHEDIIEPSDFDLMQPYYPNSPWFLKFSKPIHTIPQLHRVDLFQCLLTDQWMIDALQDCPSIHLWMCTIAVPSLLVWSKATTIRILHCALNVRVTIPAVSIMVIESPLEQYSLVDVGRPTDVLHLWFHEWNILDSIHHILTKVSNELRLTCCQTSTTGVYTLPPLVCGTLLLQHSGHPLGSRGVVRLEDTVPNLVVHSLMVLGSHTHIWQKVHTLMMRNAMIDAGPLMFPQLRECNVDVLWNHYHDMPLLKRLVVVTSGHHYMWCHRLPSLEYVEICQDTLIGWSECPSLKQVARLDTKSIGRMPISNGSHKWVEAWFRVWNTFSVKSLL